MKTLSGKKTSCHLFNVFIIVSFVLGILTLAPADATASPAVQQDPGWELELDQPPHRGRPDDWAGPGGDLIAPSGLSHPMVHGAPGPEGDNEILYMARPPMGLDERRIERPMGSIMDPQRPRQVDPEIRELPMRPYTDQQREVDSTGLLVETNIERDVPFFYIDLCWNDIYGPNWTIGSTVDLTIDDPNIPGDVDYSDSAIVDDSGWVWFYIIDSFNLEPGQIVTLSDGSTTKIHTIIDLAVTGFNEVENSLSGTANPGSLKIYAFNSPNMEEKWSLADGDGIWTETFVSVVVGPGFGASITQSDDDGDTTYLEWYMPEPLDPRISVYPEWDNVYGNDWTPNTPVELYINNIWVSTETTDSWGYIDFYLDVDIKAGQTIKLFDGTYTREHTVTSLAVTEIDLGSNTVSGTAEPGSQVYVEANYWANWEDLITIVGTSGDWTANFTYLDIDAGSYGYAWQYDLAGNSTYIYWRVPKPGMNVYPHWDEIDSWDWIPNAPVTLTINGGELTETKNSDDGGNVGFRLDFDIQTGTKVELTDLTNTRTHTVSLEITEINEETDSVSGKATPGNVVQISACDDDTCESQYPEADGQGDWTAEFFDVEIAPGAGGSAWEDDAQGNSTIIYWNVPDPRISVYPEWDNVYGNDWTPNTPVELYINNIWVSTETTYSWGYVDFYLDVDIKAGQIIKLFDGTYTREHTVTSLAVTEIDPDMNTVSGTAAAGSQVYIDGDNGYDWENVITDVGSSGTWTANFTYLDIDAGSYGYAIQYDAQGNSTNIYWYVPDPYFQVYPLGDYIYGYRWTPNTLITASIGGSVIGSGWSNENGRVYIPSYSYDITFGNTVVLTDGTDTRTHVVKYLEVTSINQTTNVVSGKAEANTALSYVSARDNSGFWAYRYAAVDGSGNWSANFHVDVNITNGVYGWAVQADDDRNETCIRWYVPDPYMTIYPEFDQVYGSAWPANTTITLSIGTQTWTQESSYGGWVSFHTQPFDIKSGQSVTMSGGGYSKAHTVRNLAVTIIDEVNDTISGTSAAGAQLSVSACDYYCTSIDVTANSSGNWIANFSSLFDIKPGTYGFASQYDADGDSTWIRWYLRDPYFIVRPNGDYVYGYDWTSNTAVTLTINGSLIASTTSTSWGRVTFDQIAFDIQPGQEIIVSDGTYSKTHVVIDLSVTSYDNTANTLSGTANPGWLTIVAYDESNWEPKEIEADSEGTWTVSFSTVAIDVGAQAFIYQADADKDKTEIFWFIPNPRIHVYPQDGYVYGTHWPANTDITLTIDANRGTWTARSNEFGNVIFFLGAFDLLPGHRVEMKDETEDYTQEHIIKNFTVTDIDTNTNTVNGTADEDSQLVVCAINFFNQSYNQVCLDIDADISGKWVADFSGLINITRGTFGYVYQSDENDHRTTVYWEVALGFEIFLPLVVR